jgi:xanthine dehydrogenase molybdopterin-binding subunit B
VFCSGEIKYAGQPLGLIVAVTQTLALKAVSKVKVQYSNVGCPHLNMRDIISSGDKTRIRVEKEPDAVKKDGKFAQIQNRIFGNMLLAWLFIILQ